MLKDMGVLSPKDLVDVAQTQGEFFAGTMKTHQLRNFFSQVTQMKQQWKMEKTRANKEKDTAPPKGLPQKVETQLIMLKPRLAYAAGRQTSVKPFYTFISAAIDGVIKSKNPPAALQNFFDLIESVVAYHKFYGGKET